MSGAPRKIVLIGDSGVGKTSLIEYATRGRPSVESPSPTIGTGFEKLSVSECGATYNFEIWDTAGQERFRSLTRSLFKGAHGAVLVFDVTKPESLKELYSFYDVLSEVVLIDTITVILVGNKSDLVEGGRVTREEINECKTKICAECYLQASAKTGENVSEIFQALARSPLMAVQSPVAIMQQSKTTREKECGC
jgi:small GTP-binding protein